MKRTLSRLSVAGLATLAIVACTDTTSSSPSSLSSSALAAALGSVPVGFGDLTSSFIGAAASDAPSAGLWIGGGREASFDRGGLMGGGLRDEFAGGVSFDGRGAHRGPFGGPFGGQRVEPWSGRRARWEGTLGSRPRTRRTAARRHVDGADCDDDDHQLE